MKRRPCWGRAAFLVALVVCTFPAWERRPAEAILGIGDIVLDPTNLVQNSWTAFRSLQSNINEATQIQQQIQSLVMQARNLVALPMSVIDQVSALYNQYNQLLHEGKMIAFTFTNAVHQFEQLYDVATQGGDVPLMQRAQQMLGQVRATGRALTAVSAIYEKLCADQAHVQNLVVASKAAPGSLAAQQAGNELLGVLASQQASMQQMTAATARLQMTLAMREVTADEQAQRNAAQWLADFPTAGMRAPHQGQGFKLPD